MLSFVGTVIKVLKGWIILLYRQRLLDEFEGMYCEKIEADINKRACEDRNYFKNQRIHKIEDLRCPQKNVFFLAISQILEQDISV